MARTQTPVQLSGESADFDRRIVEAYTRQPQEDLIGFEAAGRRMVAAEPWDELAK